LPLRERGDDVLLLFRKFATDFAEKYRMPAIQLTEDAKRQLLAFPFPGNVRQLKNITEQISIIETNREINAGILRNYLPDVHEQRLPAVMGGGKEGKSFESEREILYSVLFDMRQEVAELKKMVHNLMAERNATVSVVPTPPTPVTATTVQEAPVIPTIIQHPVKPAAREDDDIQDTEEYVEESLSIDDVERDLIRKALEKHHGKRKSAAQDLNISERTLYRKIKEYGLE
jgi:DNA-binding NtrC family response regulator